MCNSDRQQISTRVQLCLDNVCAAEQTIDSQVHCKQAANGQQTTLACNVGEVISEMIAADCGSPTLPLSLSSLAACTTHAELCVKESSCTIAGVCQLVPMRSLRQ
jgi:hypothetical protein